MENIKERRIGFEQLGNIYAKAASVKTEQVFINGVNCYWLTPENPAANKIIIYLHGGAFVAGSILSHESMVSHFAEKLQAKVLFVDYALAPEKPFPAALNDTINVYTALLENYPGYEIDAIGDSAGGGLIVSLTGELLKRHLQLPQAAVLISPWVSLACNNPSYQENREKDPVLVAERVRNSAAAYIGDTPIETASPENVLLSAFPPVLIMVGTNEILLDDSINFYNMVKKIQPNTTLTIYENQNHVWPLANIDGEASKKLLNQVQTFLTGINLIIQ